MVNMNNQKDIIFYNEIEDPAREMAGTISKAMVK